VEDFSQIIKILKDHGIDFVLIGGLAAVVYGSSQVTQDIDICIEFTPDNLKKLRKCFRGYNPVHRMTTKHLSFLEFPEDVTTLKNVYLETDLGVIDILSHVTAVGTYQDLLKSAEEIDLFGYTCHVISIQDLIKSKKEMARFKDKIVAQELLLILKEKK